MTSKLDSGSSDRIHDYVLLVNRHVRRVVRQVDRGWSVDGVTLLRQCNDAAVLVREQAGREYVQVAGVHIRLRTWANQSQGVWVVPGKNKSVKTVIFDYNILDIPILRSGCKCSYTKRDDIFKVLSVGSI